MPRLTFVARTLSAAALLSAVPAQAAQPTNAELLAEMQRLAERISTLEEQNARLERAMADEHISETEPEIASRLKAVEYQALSMQKQVRMVDKLEDITAGASLGMVAQKASGGVDRDVQLNYRADITVATPAGTMGDTTGRIFGHFRIGQGKGLGSILTAFSGANATAFQLGTAEQASTSAVMLAQAWYQADIPLPLGGF
ncbi:MAG: carbohydrate porin, partial [Pseudomonadota bacterium]